MIRTAVNEDGWHISTKGELLQIAQIAEQIKKDGEKYDELGDSDYIYRLSHIYSGIEANSVYYSQISIRQAIADCNESIRHYCNNYNVNVNVYIPYEMGLIEIGSLDILDETVFWHKDYQAPTQANPNPSNNFSPYFITGRDLKRLLYTRNAYIIQLEKLVEDRDKQEQALKEQRDYYVSLGNDYLSQLETIFKEYSSLKEA